MPSKKINHPTLLYDDNCNFCKQCVRWLKKKTQNNIQYLPYQDNLDKFPQITPQACQQSVQLVDTNGNNTYAAEAILKALSIAGKYHWAYAYYTNNKAFRSLAKILYQTTAKNRSILSWIFK